MILHGTGMRRFYQDSILELTKEWAEMEWEAEVEQAEIMFVVDGSKQVPVRDMTEADCAKGELYPIILFRMKGMDREYVMRRWTIHERLERYLNLSLHTLYVDNSNPDPNYWTIVVEHMHCDETDN